MNLWMRWMHRLDLHNIRSDKWLTQRQKFLATEVSDRLYAGWESSDVPVSGPDAR